MRRLLVLAEGQTEELFVNRVLQPHLSRRGVWCTPTVLETRQLPGLPRNRGGVSSWSKVRRDLERLLGDSDAWVTTLLDYYGLPPDFPGRRAAPSPAASRVRTLEAAMKAALGAPRRFIPFLALHELEAWVFAAPAAVARHFGQPELEAKVKQVLAGLATPEEVNDGPDTHPSRRLIGLVPTWKKTTDGPLVLEAIGLEVIRGKCPHFDAWLRRLEALGRG